MEKQVKLTNAKEHARIGLIVGILTGFALPVLHLETLLLPVIIAAFVLMVLFELWQWKVSTNPNYLKLKWLDCLLDIAAGWIAFALPVVVLCLGIARIK
jgi:uncharacterized membrane protein YedE/YeeE